MKIQKRTDNSLAFTIGDYTISPPYSGKDNQIAIYRDGGEGGDFEKAEFLKAIEKFYNENF